MALISTILTLIVHGDVALGDDIVAVHDAHVSTVVGGGGSLHAEVRSDYVLNVVSTAQNTSHKARHKYKY